MTTLALFRLHALLFFLGGLILWFSQRVLLKLFQYNQQTCIG